LSLYSYYRSSAAYRVRIALNLKGLAYSIVPVHLLRGGGENWQESYLAINPQGLVPSLEVGDRVLGQSLAIMEYLEESYPAPPLLPADAIGRARVRALAQIIACDIHPLDNLRVRDYLKGPLGLGEDEMGAWYCHWIEAGFRALEARLRRDPETGAFCHGDAPTLADCCLVPQVYNARRHGCALDAYTQIREITGNCLELEAFREAAPEAQPDAEPGRNS
jgi:maleylacetoacetate isomerase/maleylpyruvate isomerase